MPGYLHHLLLLLCSAAIAASAAGASAGGAAAATCDSCALTAQTVCGADGLEYQNECLATCQDVAVAHAGSCPGATPDARGPYLSTSGRVTRQEMAELQAEGYRLVGQHRLVRHEPKPRKPPAQMQQHSGKGGHHRHVAVQYLSGDLANIYMKPQHHAADEVFVESKPFWPTHKDSSAVGRTNGTLEGPHTGVAEGGSHGPLTSTSLPPRRSLKHSSGPNTQTSGLQPRRAVQYSSGVDAQSAGPSQRRLLMHSRGADTQSAGVHPGRTLQYNSGIDERSEITVDSKPYSAVGRYTYKEADGTDGACTAALISDSIAITAAHCVYNEILGAYTSSRVFYADVYSGRNPYSGVRVKRAVTFDVWVQSQEPGYDIAVLYLEKPIGKKVGYFGTSYTCGARLYYLQLVGYPDDKPIRTMWRSSCGVNADMCTTPLLDHTCWSVGGDSGAPMFDAEGVVRAVHSCTSFSMPVNCATSIRPDTYSIISDALKATTKKGPSKPRKALQG